MQNDLAAGKLNALIAKAESDINAHRVKDLNGVNIAIGYALIILDDGYFSFDNQLLQIKYYL